MSRNEVQSMLERFGGKKRFVLNLLLEKSLGLLDCSCVNITQHILAFWPKNVWNGLQKSSGVSSCFISTVSHICLSSQLTSARWCRPRRNVWSVWRRTTWREPNTSWSSCGTTTTARGYSCSLHFTNTQRNGWNSVLEQSPHPLKRAPESRHHSCESFSALKWKTGKLNLFKYPSNLSFCHLMSPKDA